jgi:hypothetical protein
MAKQLFRTRPPMEASAGEQPSLMLVVPSRSELETGGALLLHMI